MPFLILGQTEIWQGNTLETRLQSETRKNGMQFLISKSQRIGRLEISKSLRIISVFIVLLSVIRYVLLSTRDAELAALPSKCYATLRSCTPKVPQPPPLSPPPLAVGGLCGQRMTPPKPGALAAAGGMRRADGAPGPPGGSPVPGREAAVGTKRHADGSVADGACAGAPTPRAPGARRRTDSTASAPPRPRGTAALRRLHAT